jgi:UDP-N-acetylmuramate dehydrogenase
MNNDINHTLLSELAQLPQNEIRTNEPLAAHTSWGIGGPADIMVIPHSVVGLRELIKFLHARGLKWVVIAGGSNLLINDLGIRPIVIKMGSNLSAVQIKGDHVLVESGKYVPCLARQVGCAGLSGLEHIVGIPGTLGGLVAMNGGSRRKSIGDHVICVQAVDEFGQLVEFTREECGFSYRTSIFQKAKLVIARVEMRFEPGSSRHSRSLMLEILQERRSKFPLKTKNCGSVFISNPANYERWGPPGSIIERAGLKGYSVGHASVSCQHANFFLNDGDSTAGQMVELVHFVVKEIYQKLGAELECEVRYMKEDGSTLPVNEVTV